MGAYEFGSFPFRILTVVKQVDGKTNVTWLSRPGDTYVIWSCASSLGAGWTNRATAPSQGAITSWTDGTPSGSMFYRIELR
jgi:hypothetical protein